ncbi:unnamed protein product [Brassica rapa subsp. narinosa]
MICFGFLDFCHQMMLINQTPTIELGFRRSSAIELGFRGSGILVRWSESLTTGKWIN